MKDFLEACKMKKLLKQEKKTNPIVVILVIIGVIVVVAAAAYAIYRFFVPELLDDYDEFDDEFDEDFFEDDEILLDDSVESEVFED